RRADHRGRHRALQGDRAAQTVLADEAFQAGPLRAGADDAARHAYVAVPQAGARQDEVGKALLLDQPAHRDHGEWIPPVGPGTAEGAGIDPAGYDHDVAHTGPVSLQMTAVVLADRDGWSRPPQLPLHVERVPEDVEGVTRERELATHAGGGDHRRGRRHPGEVG